MLGEVAAVADWVRLFRGELVLEVLLVDEGLD